MEQIKDLLTEYADSGGELYYTEKQNRVLKAVVENPTASRSTIADEAGCHQSYVNYVLERASPDVIQAMIEEIGDGLSEETKESLKETAPPLLDTFGASSSGSAGATGAVFGVGNETEEDQPESTLEVFRSGESQIQDIQKNDDGSTDITMIRQVPVEVTVSVPTEIFDSEVSNLFGEGGLAAVAKEVNTEDLLSA
jgi:hypothetical protein